MDNSFVYAAYREHFSEEEKMRYESAGLSRLGEVSQYGDWNKEGYEKCITIPYDVAFSGRFPFDDKEQVIIEIAENSMIIKKKPR